MDVGVRQFRSELRKWLDAVNMGEEIVVTERGKPVARLVAASARPRLEALVKAGVITRPARPARPARASKRLPATGSVSELVRDQRR